MAHEVFISYSHTDKTIADAVCHGLERAGVRCWIAPRDIVPGQTWAETIVTAIHASRILVIVVSTGSMLSRQVVREVERAVSHGTVIIPFRVEDAPLSPAMSYFLGTQHWLDALTPPLEQHIASLARTVSTLLEVDRNGGTPVGTHAFVLGFGTSLRPDAQPRARVTQVPTPTSAILGRTKELTDIVALLEDDDVRLVVLTGAAGSGKTRLAIEVGHSASQRSNRFPDGITFVSLTRLNDAELVPSSIAQSLKIREEPGVPVLETLVNFLCEKDALVLLDNFEHVLAATGTLAELLSRCARVKILVTSRTALRLHGETEYPVQPLPVRAHGIRVTADDAARWPAVELFVTRMRARNPKFALTEENASTITEICARLDGLPLAIELAAARGKLLTPTAMLARLERRFDLLRGGSTDGPAHQQTLRDAIAWSYDLLKEEERTLFRRLSVFAGGFTLETVESIAHAVTVDGLDVMTGLEALLDNNLLVQHDDDEGGTRLSMLISIREFGMEQLSLAGEFDALHSAYGLFLVRMAEDALKAMQGVEQGGWLRRLEREHPNFRAALAWCSRADSALGVQLAGALARFWWMQGYLTEGRRWLAALLANVDRSTVEERVAARAYIGIGTLAWCQSDLDVAGRHFEAALEIYRGLADRGGEAASLNALGLVARSRGDHSAAWALHDESLTIRRALGLEAGVASSLNNLGVLAQARGDLESARFHHEESLRIRRTIGDRWGMVLCLNDLGSLEFLQGKAEKGRLRHREALEIARALGDRAGIATSLAGLASIAQRAGDLSEAHGLYLEALTTNEELGDRFAIARSLWAGARLAMTAGAADTAAELAGAASTILRTIGANGRGADMPDEARLLAAAREVLGPAGFGAAWSRGESMTCPQAQERFTKLSIARQERALV